MKWIGHVARWEEMRNDIKFWLENLKGRPRHRWDGDIKVFV
jgi:hypothetical protein